MNAYIKFGEILPICSQDIKLKQIFCVNQGPKLWYKFVKNDMTAKTQSDRDIQRGICYGLITSSLLLKIV